jgi:hypothetical protein
LTIAELVKNVTWLKDSQSDSDAPKDGFSGSGYQVIRERLATAELLMKEHMYVFHESRVRTQNWMLSNPERSGLE